MKLPVASSRHLSEIKALTGLRGLAAIYVVFYHFFSPLQLTSPAFCFLAHGYLAVDTFFVLSGFVMALNYVGLFAHGVTLPNVLTFFIRRLARIYPLYLLSLLIAAALVLTGHLDFKGGSLAHSFWPNLFMVQNWANWESIQTPAWSLSTEWFAYLTFPFLVRWIFLYPRALALALACLSIGGLCWLTLRYTSPYDHLKILDLTKGPVSLIRCTSEFTLGMLAYRSRNSRLGAALNQLSWLPVLLAIMILVLLGVRKTDLAIVLLMAGLILSLSGRASLASRLLSSRIPEFLGLISYSLYLMHYLLVPILNYLDLQVRSLGYGHSHSYAVAAVVPLLLVCATGTYYLVEIPARRALRHLLEGREAASFVL